MGREVKDLLDARTILAQAYMDSVGLWPAHEKVWRAIQYIDKQLTPLVEAALTELPSA